MSDQTPLESMSEVDGIELIEIIKEKGDLIKSTMSNQSPLKGMLEVDGIEAIKIIKEKISEEGYLFCEPTNDVRSKKG